MAEQDRRELFAQEADKRAKGLKLKAMNSDLDWFANHLYHQAILLEGVAMGLRADTTPGILRIRSTFIAENLELRVPEESVIGQAITTQDVPGKYRLTELPVKSVGEQPIY